MRNEKLAPMNSTLALAGRTLRNSSDNYARVVPGSNLFDTTVEASNKAKETLMLLSSPVSRGEEGTLLCHWSVIL